MNAAEGEEADRTGPDRTGPNRRRGEAEGGLGEADAVPAEIIQRRAYLWDREREREREREKGASIADLCLLS